MEKAEQMIHWLEEERRQDKIRLAELKQQITEQTSLIQNLNQHLSQLEERLTHLQAEQVKQVRSEQILDQVRNEVGLQLQRHTAAARQAEEEALRVRQAEFERVSKSWSEVKQQVDAWQEAMRNMQAQTSEVKRMTEQMVKLQQNVTTLTKQVEAHAAKFQLVEMWEDRAAKQVADLKQIEAGIKEELRQQMEAERQREEERRKQMGEWQRQMAEMRQSWEIWARQMTQATELREAARKLHDRLLDLEKTLAKERDELRVLFRQGDERQKKAFSQYQADNEKRWKRNQTQWALQRREQADTLRKQGERIEALENTLEHHAAQLAAMQQLWTQEMREDIYRFQQAITQIEDVKQPKRVGRKRAKA